MESTVRILQQSKLTTRRYNDKKTGEEDAYLLGYIPHDENTEIANLLEMGCGNIFECHINQIDPEVHPEEQIHLVIMIKKSKG